MTWNTIRFQLHVRMACRCLLGSLVVGVTFQTAMLQDSVRVHTQLRLCLSAPRDDEARGTVLCQNLDGRKRAFVLWKKGLACFWELVCIGLLAGLQSSFNNQLFVRRFWVCNEAILNSWRHLQICCRMHRTFHNIKPSAHRLSQR